MKNIQDRLQKILGGFEKEVLSLLSEAASEGDFNAIEVSKSVAFSIRRIREDLGQTELELRKDQGTRPAGETRGGTQHPKRASRGPGRGDFPKFEVMDGSLIKTGWSKKKKATYQQRVPRDTFEQVVSALRELAQNHKLVSTEVIKDRVEGLIPGLPSYQTYVVLAFLRAKGAIRSVGRGGYALELDTDGKALKAWNSTSEPTDTVTDHDHKS
jgi:hypothetical protein